jgi:hypothetical protein
LLTEYKCYFWGLYSNQISFIDLILWVFFSSVWVLSLHGSSEDSQVCYLWFSFIMLLCKKNNTWKEQPLVVVSGTTHVLIPIDQGRNQTRTRWLLKWEMFVWIVFQTRTHFSSENKEQPVLNYTWVCFKSIWMVWCI